MSLTRMALLAMAGSLLFSAGACADLIQITGEVDDLPLNGEGFINETFSASFSLVVDLSLSIPDPTVNDPNLLIVEDIPLSTLTLSPATFGTTTFNQSNTAALALVEQDTVVGLLIYGTPNGTSIFSNTDDFDFFVNWATGDFDVSGMSGVSASSAAFPSSIYSIDSAGTGFVTLQSVPEPNALLLVAMSCVGFVVRRS